MSGKRHNWFASIDRVVTEGVGNAMDRAAPRMVDIVTNALFDHPFYPMLAGGQLRLVKAGMKPRAAWEKARAVIVAWMKDEGIAFGAPGYGWGADAGAEIVEECEIAYWETAHDD